MAQRVGDFGNERIGHLPVQLGRRRVLSRVVIRRAKAVAVTKRYSYAIGVYRLNDVPGDIVLLVRVNRATGCVQPVTYPGNVAARRVVRVGEILPTRTILRAAITKAGNAWTSDQLRMESVWRRVVIVF